MLIRRILPLYYRRIEIGHNQFTFAEPLIQMTKIYVNL